jgi:hypothetical protein
MEPLAKQGQRSVVFRTLDEWAVRYPDAVDAWVNKRVEVGKYEIRGLPVTVALMDEAPHIENVRLVIKVETIPL